MSHDEKTRLMPRAPEVGTGTRLSGIYELDERLGAGGMGEVYRGHNIETGDPVAIKIVLPEFARDPAILALFRKEASILNHLSHEAIVRYHVFTIDQGLARPYLAMEFVNGESLAQIIGRGRLPTDRVWKLCQRVASGLAAAHEAGVIHRDLSPDNIILPEGKVEKAKIIDFGIARSAFAGGGTLLGGKFAGKHNYVSPEQLGLFGGEITERSDIYSLGLVLAAALRGRPLDMAGTQLEIVEKRRTVPDLTNIDPGFRPLLEAMLQPDPRNRPATMNELANYLVPPQAIAPAHGSAGMAAATRPPDRPPLSGERPHAPPSSRQPLRSRGRQAIATTLIAASLLTAAGLAAYRLGVFEGQTLGEGTRPGAVAGEKQATLNAPAAALPGSPEGEEPGEPAATQAHENRQGDDVGDRLLWLRNYAGGDCFYATATSSSAAQLEGFSQSVEPFVGLQDAFKRTFGITPEVGVRLIEPAQCGVTELLRDLDDPHFERPQLILRQMALPDGAEIRGTLQGLNGRKAQLMLIDHRGIAYSLDSRLKHADGAVAFSINIGMTPADLKRGKPMGQLILALTSPDGIGAASFSGPIPADDLFARIMSEARTRQLNATAVAKYFRLGG